MKNLPKFRAWHKELKELLPVVELSYIFNHVIAERPQKHMGVHAGSKWLLSDIELMQCTGFKGVLDDESEQDIYVGDIVHYFFDVCTRGSLNRICKVIFEDGQFLLECLDPISCEDDYYVLHDEPYAFMIIGNIYENRDLLEAK